MQKINLLSIFGLSDEVIERLAELNRIYVIGPGRGEVRRTAISWQPDESYTEVHGKTPSGQREYSKVEREAK